MAPIAKETILSSTLRIFRAFLGWRVCSFGQRYQAATGCARSSVSVNGARTVEGSAKRGAFLEPTKTS
jgi:hypothetical protein